MKRDGEITYSNNKNSIQQNSTHQTRRRKIKKLQLYRTDVERHWKYTSSIRVVLFQFHSLKCIGIIICESGNFQFIKIHTHSYTIKGALEVDAVFNGNNILQKKETKTKIKSSSQREDKY